MFRTAFSHDVVEVHDMSTGLYDDPRAARDGVRPRHAARPRGRDHAPYRGRHAGGDRRAPRRRVPPRDGDGDRGHRGAADARGHGADRGERRVRRFHRHRGAGALARELSHQLHAGVRCVAAQARVRPHPAEQSGDLRAAARVGARGHAAHSDLSRGVLLAPCRRGCWSRS